MPVRFHPHALNCLGERGCTEADVVAAVTEGEAFPAKYGRQGFRRNFPYNGIWLEKWYATKQLEVFAVP
ncbi:MAG: hypothetical protein HY532_03615 [Chloroflexi bacterium]|nr:hypothetical protein [Chloroflexota bacterium]